jgi:hypothetical protein
LSYTLNFGHHTKRPMVSGACCSATRGNLFNRR